MRWLIDGYNVMYAAGRLGPRLSREGFRRARRKFVDEVADAIPAPKDGDVTIVFDASVPPGDFPLSSRYRGIRVIFAYGDENADARIEYILAQDSNPRTLTVVSTDRRIRDAASRRRARSLTADAFLDVKDNPRLLAPPRSAPRILDRDQLMAIDDPDFWVVEFAEVEEIPGFGDIEAPGEAMLTDAEIAEIQRIIDREG